MKMIIWDWNGTLLDDTQAALDTLNAMLTRRDGQTMDLAYFRDHFSFPAREFYARIGMEVSDAEWAALAREYFVSYSARPKALNADARVALETVRSAGVRQVMLSALRQDFLEAALVEYGIRDFFEGVYGVDNIDGASKLDRAREIFPQLQIAPADVVLIGDALHDKEVADALGAHCVLCAQGSHSFARLQAVAPTGHTLIEAIRLALA